MVGYVVGCVVLGLLCSFLITILDKRNSRRSGVEDRRSGVSGVEDKRSGVSEVEDRRSGVSGVENRRSGVSGVEDRRSGAEVPDNIMRKVPRQISERATTKSYFQGATERNLLFLEDFSTYL